MPAHAPPRCRPGARPAPTPRRAAAAPARRGTETPGRRGVRLSPAHPTGSDTADGQRRLIGQERPTTAGFEEGRMHRLTAWIVLGVLMAGVPAGVRADD